MSFSLQGAFDVGVEAANASSDGLAAVQTAVATAESIPNWVQGAIDGVKQSATTGATAACGAFLGPAAPLCGIVVGEVVGWFAQEVFPVIGQFLEDVGKELKHFFQCTIGGNCPKPPILLSNRPYIDWIRQSTGARPSDSELTGFGMFRDYVELGNRSLQVSVWQLVWLAQQTPGAPPGYTEQECLRRLRAAGAPLVRYGSASYVAEYQEHERYWFENAIATDCALESFELTDHGPEFWKHRFMARVERGRCVAPGAVYWFPSWVASYQQNYLRSSSGTRRMWPGFSESVRFDPYTVQVWVDQIWTAKMRFMYEAVQREAARIVNAAAVNVAIWTAVGAQTAQAEAESGQYQEALVWLARWGFAAMTQAEQSAFQRCVEELGGWRAAPDAEVARCRAAISGPQFSDIPDGTPAGSVAIPLVLLGSAVAGVAAWKAGLFSRLAAG